MEIDPGAPGAPEPESRGPADGQSPPATSRRQFLIRGGGLAAGALLAGPLVAACGSSSKKTSSGGSATTTGSGSTTPSGSTGSSGGSLKGTLKIGLLAPTTGLLAASYGPLAFNAELAVSQINAAGGILGQKVVLVHQDDGGSAAQEPQAVKQLYSSGVRYLLGPIGSSQASAALAVATPLKMIQCSWGSDIKEGDPKLHPYNFTCFPTTQQVGALFADFLVSRLGYKKIGLLLENSDYGTAIQAAVQGPVKAAGGRIVAAQSYPVTATSFNSYIQNLKSAGTEAILGAMGNPPNILAAYQSMADLKWYPTLASNATDLTGVVQEDSNFPAQLTSNVYAYSVKPFTYPKGGTPPQATIDYIKTAQAFPGYKPTSLLGGPFYDFLFMLKQAIEAAGSTNVDKVKSAMEDIKNFPGKVGILSFSTTSHNSVPADDVVPIFAQSATAPQSLGGQVYQRANGY